MAAGNSIFDAYDQEFTNLSQEIQKNINELKTFPSGSDRSPSVIRHIDGLMGQANDLVKQMNVEVRSQDPATRKILTEKVNQYMRSLASNKTDFERAREQSQRSALIGERSGADRQKLLSTNDKLERQNEMILNATRTIEETREVGIEITGELARNREKIESSRARALEFNGITDAAGRVLNSMSRRETRQKWIIVFVGLLLLLGIILVAYFSTAGKTQSSSSTGK